MVRYGIESPEELLEKLYYLLYLRKILSALALFSQNSYPNHIVRFERVLYRYNRCDYNGEYIVLGYNGGFSIVGLDDNYRFFCHPVDHEGSLDPSNIAMVRQAMGFNYHSWEIKRWDGTLNRRIIRAQGDIVIVVNKVFGGEESIKRQIFFASLMESLLLVFTRFLPKYMMFPLVDYLNEYLVRMDITPENIDDTIVRYLLYSLLGKKLYTKLLIMGFIDDDLIDAIIKSSIKRTKTILRLETLNKVFIGDHIARFPGIQAPRVFRYLPNFGSIMLLLNNNIDTFLILRKTEIVFNHPEHKTLTIEVEPSSISLGSLVLGHLPRMNIRVYDTFLDSRTARIRIGLIGDAMPISMVAAHAVLEAYKLYYMWPRIHVPRRTAIEAIYNNRIRPRIDFVERIFWLYDAVVNGFLGYLKEERDYFRVIFYEPIPSRSGYHRVLFDMLGTHVLKEKENKNLFIPDALGRVDVVVVAHKTIDRNIKDGLSHIYHYVRRFGVKPMLIVGVPPVRRLTHDQEITNILVKRGLLEYANRISSIIKTKVYFVDYDTFIPNRQLAITIARIVNKTTKTKRAPYT